MLRIMASVLHPVLGRSSVVCDREHSHQVCHNERQIVLDADRTIVLTEVSYPGFEKSFVR